MKPRMPYSPPPTPTITLSLTTERRMRDRVARRRVGRPRLPDLTPALRVDGNQVRVERAHEQRVAEDRDAAVVGAAADDAIPGFGV